MVVGSRLENRMNIQTYIHTAVHLLSSDMPSSWFENVVMILRPILTVDRGWSADVTCFSTVERMCSSMSRQGRLLESYTRKV